MIRRILPAFLVASVVIVAVARAGDGVKQALSAIPADAMGFVCVPSIKDLDRDYQQAINDLELQALLQPPMNSIVGLLKQKLPMFENVDEEGFLAVVFMPAQVLFEIQQKQVMLVPAKDPKAMIEALQGQPGEGDVWTLSMMGQPFHAAIKRNMVIFGQSAEIVKTVKASEGGIDQKLQASELKVLEGLDLAVWFDGDRFLKLIKPMADMAINAPLLSQPPSNPLEAVSIEMNKKNMELFFEGISSLCLGVGMDAAGLGLRGTITTKPGSGLARQWKVRTTTGPLLDGLPAAKYIIAAGQLSDPDQSREAVKNLDPFFAAFEGIEGIDRAKVGQLKGLTHEWLPMMTGLRVSIEGLPAGPHGLIGISVLADTTDSKKWLESLGKGVDLLKQIIASMEGTPLDDDDFRMIARAIKHDTEAEEIDRVKVHHLKVDFAKIDDLDEEDVEELMKVIGKDGALVRMAPVNGKTVAATFGGGPIRLAKLIKQAKTDETPLANDAGVKKVAPSLPKDRASVCYIALDQGVVLAKRIMQALDEEPFPVEVPELDAPLVLSVTGAEGWIRLDLLFPKELLLAGKNVVMAMMAPPAPPPGEVPPSPPPVTGP